MAEGLNLLRDTGTPSSVADASGSLKSSIRGSCGGSAATSRLQIWSSSMWTVSSGMLRFEMRNEKADRRHDYERLEEDEWEGKKEARNPNFLRQVTCQYRESLDRRRRRKSEFLPRASTFFSSKFGQLRSFTGRHTWIRTMLHFSSVPVAMSSTASMPNVLETRNMYTRGPARMRYSIPLGCGKPSRYTMSERRVRPTACFCLAPSCRGLRELDWRCAQR